MQENQSPYAVFQIGLGIICILIGISGFILSLRYLLALEAMSLGIGILLNGLVANDKSEKGKKILAVSYIFYVIGVILIFYNTFFNSKN